jgi:hypothetical protein
MGDHVLTKTLFHVSHSSAPPSELVFTMHCLPVKLLTVTGKQMIQGGLAVISSSASLEHVPEDAYRLPPALIGNGERGSAPLSRTVRVARHQIRKPNLRYEVEDKNDTRARAVKRITTSRAGLASISPAPRTRA